MLRSCSGFVLLACSFGHAQGSARVLPAERTFAAIELPPLVRILDGARDLPMIRALRHPRFDALLRVVSAEAPELREVLESRSGWMRLLDRFDEGMAGAFLFTAGRATRARPYFYMVGTASDPARLRGFDNAIFKAIARARADAALAPIEKRRLALPDRSTSLTVLEAHRDRKESGQSLRMANYVARRGAIAGFHGGYHYVPNEAAIVRADAGVASVFENVFEARSRDAMQIGEQASAGDEEVLARGVVRFSELVESPTYRVLPNTIREIRAGGFWQWDGLTARLLRVSDGLREVLESHDARVEGDTHFRFVRGDGRGLGDAAAFLPATALAAIRIPIDAEMASRWLTGLGRQFRFEAELQWISSICRDVLGLQPPASASGLIGVSEITIALMPPAPGALAPEPCLLLRMPGGDDQAEGVIARLAKRIGSGGERKSGVKLLGKGADRIPYVSIKDLFVGQAHAFLGGGYVSAARTGPYLVIGCNPRTVRALSRAGSTRSTLASRDGFLDRFEPASNRFFEAWFDWKGIVRDLRIVDQLLWVWIARRSTSRDGVVRRDLLTTRDVADLVDEQWIRGERTEFGHRLEFEGSLVLSPLAISTLFMAEQLYREARRLSHW